MLPLAVLFSWGILPGEHSVVSKPVGFWIVPVFYLLILFGLTTACARSRHAWSFLPFVIHGVGVVVALMAVTQHPEHGADATAGFMRASYITAALLTAYLFSAIRGWHDTSGRNSLHSSRSPMRAEGIRVPRNIAREPNSLSRRIAPRLQRPAAACGSNQSKIESCYELVRRPLSR
jgi:hypothetical protein